MSVEQDGSARCVVPAPVPDDVLVHPVLATAAACLALHGAGDVLHGALVLAAGGAVAVLAPRGGGKTTTMAHLAGRGATVLADDQVVMRGSVAFAGPRCLDLRPSAAALLDGDAPAAPVRGGARHRLRLPPCPDAVELTGIVVLDFGERFAVHTVPPVERLPLLARHRTAPGRAGDLTVPLALAALPCRRVVRPRGRAGLDAVAGLLLG
jgi:hypothetical protein